MTKLFGKSCRRFKIADKTYYVMKPIMFLGGIYYARIIYYHGGTKAEPK